MTHSFSEKRPGISTAGNQFPLPRRTSEDDFTDPARTCAWRSAKEYGPSSAPMRCSMKASPGPTVGAVIGPLPCGLESHPCYAAGRLSPVFRLVRTEYSQDANWRQEEEPVQTIGIVLNVGAAQADEFEQGFRAEEAPIWDDLHARGLLVMATLTRLDISTRKVDGAAVPGGRDLRDR